MIIDQSCCKIKSFLSDSRSLCCDEKCFTDERRIAICVNGLYIIFISNPNKIKRKYEKKQSDMKERLGRSPRRRVGCVGEAAWPAADWRPVWDSVTS